MTSPTGPSHPTPTHPTPTGPGRAIKAVLAGALALLLAVVLGLAGCRHAALPAESPHPMLSGRQAPP